MSRGEKIEIFRPREPFFEQSIEEMRDEEGNVIESAPHPKQTVFMKMKKPVAPNYMLRIRKGEE